MQKCKHCGGDLILTKEGELVCTRCGVVEQPFFLQNQQQVSEITALTDLVRKGSTFSEKARHITKHRVGDLAFVHKKLSGGTSHDPDVRALLALSKTCAVLNLPDDIKSRAVIYYWLMRQRPRVKRITTLVLSAMALYAAIKEQVPPIPISLNKICKIYQSFGHRVKPFSVLRAGTYFGNIIKSIKKLRHPTDYLPTLASFLVDVILPKYKSKMRNLPPRIYYEIIDKARHLLENVPRSILEGRNWYGIACAATFLAFYKMTGGKRRCPIPVPEAAAFFGIPEYSMRDYMRLLSKYSTS